jgi:hypothetical protein
MPKGGRRPGAGRPPGKRRAPGAGRPNGSPNLKSSYKILKELGELMPLDFMISEMRRLAKEATDDSLREARMLAQAAAPYCHPRLQAIMAKTTLESGDTLTALLRAIDGSTTGIGDCEEPKEPALAIGSPIHVRH